MNKLKWAVFTSQTHLTPTSMKHSRLLFSLATGALLGSSAMAQEARLQIIHNSADAAAAVVDIYVNDALFLDDVAFRTATDFMDVPAEADLAVGIAPGNSMGAGDIIATFDYAYLVSAAIWGFVFFAETPDIFTICGMVLITAAGLLVAVRPANRVVSGQRS